MTEASHGSLNYIAPRDLPEKQSCYFYHSIDLPEGESIGGAWDIRGRFSQYIGGCDLRGRTVFDVGTAGGFLSFSSELEGAAAVTALEVPSLFNQTRVPFAGREYVLNKREWALKNDSGLERAKNGFWYCWHKLNSSVRVCYNTLDDLYSVDERFDVVLAGALLEHLGDPVSAIGAICRLARETAIIAFTPVDIHAENAYLRPLVEWRPEPHASPHFG